ncbi:MAG: hypothetical protein H0X26_01210 [Alphaproteobacteria bacterium]|nr:hypothetical protein [Alphaproteobacteria bacterium]
MKKQLLALLVTTSLSMVHSVSAMEADENEDFRNQYLVHLSNIMAKDSTKIAGAQKRSYAITDFTLKPSPIDPEGSNIRERITLHHCFGTVVPEKSHGASIESPLGRIKLPSDLYTDKEMCAFLDPLSEFLRKGELVAGVLGDMQSIDRHKYGKNSIVILPLHREDEFKRQNPDFKGKCILFDSNTASIAEKVDEVISDCLPLQATMKNIYQQINDEFISAGKSPTYDYVEKLFKENNLKFVGHNETPFKALEQLLGPLWRQIHSARAGKNTIVTSADQIPSRLAMVRSLIDLTLDFAWPGVGEKSKLALKTWQQDTLNWLNLFELDGGLRTEYQTSLFLNNPHLELFIKNRADQQELLRLAFLHLNPLHDDEKLKLQSQSLFPELLSKGIISSPEMSDFLNHTDFQVLNSLKKRLVQLGYADEGYGLLLIRLLGDLSSDAQKGYSLDKDQLIKLTKCLKGLSPASRLQDHIKPIIESFMLGDQSYQNKRTRNFLNGETGKLLQKKIFGQAKEWDFIDLLREYEGTKILFPELKCVSASEESAPLFKNFAQIVSKWMFEKALKETHLKSDTQTLEIPQPRYSLYNVREAYETMARKLELYEKYLLYPLGEKRTDHPLNVLIEEGCFASWPDLFHRLIPLFETLSEKEINQISARFSTIEDAYITINQREVEKQNKILAYERKVEKVISEREEEGRKWDMRLQGGKMSFGIRSAVNFFASRAEKVVCCFGMYPNFLRTEENSATYYYNPLDGTFCAEHCIVYKIIFEPNSAMAWYAYNKGMEVAKGPRDVEILQRYMQPVFQKAILPFKGS